MARDQYLEFQVALSDENRVAELQAQYPNGYIVAPRTGAAVEFSAPWTGSTPPVPGVNTTWSNWAGGGGNFPTDVATFTRKSGGWFGIPLLFGQTTRFYWVARFVVNPALTVQGTATDPVLPQPMPQRLWIDGFELPLSTSTSSGEGGSGATPRVSRDASRTVDGLGLALRGSTGSRIRRVDEFDAAFAGVGCKDLRERLYARLRRNPDVTTAWWRLKLFSPASGGMEMYILPSGQVAVYNVTSAGVAELLSTTTDSLPVQTSTGRHARLEILSENNPAASYADTGDTNRGRFRVYKDGLLWIDLSRPEGSLGNPNSGLGVVGARVISSELGNNRGGANQLELDIDDWIGTLMPTIVTAPEPWASTVAYVTNDRVLHGGFTYRALAASTNQQPPNATYWTRELTGDWVNGSHVAIVRPSAFAAEHSANWTGDVRMLLQNPPNNTTTFGNSRLTSSTSGALLSVESDFTRIQGRYQTIGTIAFVVGKFGAKTAAAADGQLGYQVNSEAAVMAAITEAADPGRWSSAMYRPTGVTEPTQITALKLRHTKGADANQSVVRGLFAAVEFIGQFGPEDQTAGPQDTAATVPTEPAGPENIPAIHNAPYPDTPWATPGVAPFSPVAIYAGTYVGTGDNNGVDLTFKTPVHWLWIRPITGDVGGARWWASMLAGHIANQRGANPQGINIVEKDPTFVPAGTEDSQEMRFRLRVSGPITQTNASGVTYQYVAFSDPGMRFSIAGAFAHPTSVDPADNALPKSTFVPDGCWLQVEQPEPSATSDTWFKGPGDATAGASKLDAAADTSALEFRSGGILRTNQDAFHQAGQTGTVAYMVFRKDDGSTDAGRVRVVAIVSYIGDGTASRTVGFSPSTGVRPLWAIVVPSGGAGAIMRDPSHTGTTSTNASTGAANASTGITSGGIDQISVGSALNSNGVTYNVFVLLGSSTAGNNGWGANGEYFPVEPDSPSDGPYDSNPTQPAATPTTPVPDPGDLTTDIAAACLAASTRMCNLALQELGITQQIASLQTEVSKEAQACRLVYKTIVDQVLRAFPWPFATRYAVLTLVGGTTSTALNADWQYSYRLPSDYVYARRIQRKSLGWKRGGSSIGPQPEIPFRVAADDTGELLYTDLGIDTTVTPNVGPELEYTFRVACPASRGDAIFRQALVYRLAAALAKPLGREAKDRDSMMAYYHGQLREAKTVHANEQEHQDNQGPEADWIAGR